MARKTKEQKQQERANNLVKAVEGVRRNDEGMSAAGTGQSIANANQTNDGQAVMQKAAEIDAEKLKPRSEEGAANIAQKEQELSAANTANTEARMTGTETAYSGPTVDNTNEGIANAKPGDVVQRKDGTFYTLTQGDINFAQSQLSRGVEESPDVIANKDEAAEETTPPEATPKQKETVEEQVEEAKPEIEQQSEEQAIDQAANQASQQTGQDKSVWKDKIKQIYGMFKSGALKPGTDGYFIANSIATFAYNIGELMEKNFRNSLWSHIDSGTFENPQFKKSFYEQQTEAEIAQKAQQDIAREGNIKDQEAQADFDYNKKYEIVTNSDFYKASPEAKAQYTLATRAIQGQPLSPEEYLQISDISGELKNLKAGRDRQATLEGLAIKAQSLANADADIKLKYADDLMAAQLKADELANIALGFPGSISVNAKGGVPGFGSVGGAVEIPYTTMISVASTLGKTVSEVVSALESGDKSVLDAFKNVGESATKSRK